MAEGHNEIIIVRRHGDHDDGHHGGAWKIALADFMTAMMALFLVMWLINSTSKETKTAVASYFNPVKLAEMVPDRKGLRDPVGAEGPAEGKGAEAKGSDGKDGSGKDPGKDDKGGGGKGRAEGAAAGSRGREAALFQDPYAVLARLAAEAEPERPVEVSSPDAASTEDGLPGLSGGEAARDPFDPLYWQVAPLPAARAERPGRVDTLAPQDGRPDARAATPDPRPVPGPRKDAAAVRVAAAEALPLTPKDPPRDPAGAAAKDVAREPAKDPKAKDPAAPKLAALDPKADLKADPRADAKAAAAKDPSKDPAEAAETAAAAALKAEILKAVEPLPTAAPAPRIDVRRTGEGVLISLTDEFNFMMFGVGSAEPQPKVVRALERIARILNARPGRIVVRGHTDSRPFRSETYDNWRLSSARAQMATYMLVRGGLDEARVERIEGHADRQPRNPADTKSAENRRIEILLRGRPE
ncbi:MotB family protein [Methylobacterium oryzihabitans]|uniref:MotB family protein n=1 Tax=Methylobacterium oryzihabitans TaxID=2499852 RepID=A0A3S2V1J3_9HYPH|nr:MotB family protein [Methylobacterium oryzihabitans]RVU11945.1 MotB family protein [Methylobacterium oryzihabitans]